MLFKMLSISYLLGILSERRLTEGVKVSVAYHHIIADIDARSLVCGGLRCFAPASRIWRLGGGRGILAGGVGVIASLRKGQTWLLE